MSTIDQTAPAVNRDDGPQHEYDYRERNDDAEMDAWVCETVQRLFDIRQTPERRAA